MQRIRPILFTGLLLGLASYACIYRMGTATDRSVGKSENPALAWLRHEYHLTDGQFDRIAALHEAYLPRCREMCRRIDEQNTRLSRLLAEADTVTPEIKTALAEAAQLRAMCQAAMLDHFYEVAQAMSPDQGRRYLAWVRSETLLPARMAPTQPSFPQATP